MSETVVHFRGRDHSELFFVVVVVFSGTLLSLLWTGASSLLQGDTNLPDSGDSWIGDVRGRSTVRNSHLNLAGSPWKSLAYSE